MRVIVAGSRGVRGDLIRDAIDGSGYLVRELVVGHEPGADIAAEAWGDARGIPVRRFEIHEGDRVAVGRLSSSVRNRRMASYADGLVAVISGPSPDLEDLLRVAMACDLRISLVSI